MDIALTIILILLINIFLTRSLIGRYHFISENYLWLLFVAHFLMTIAYILYALYTASDSMSYYRATVKSDDWFVFFKSGTQFVNFLAWPFTRLLGLSYLSTMIVFSYFGYIGTLLFYICAKENVKLNSVWQNLSAVELAFLLPNLHFWSSSLGKGSLIVLGIAIFTFGLSRFNKRFIYIIVGSLLIFYIRPHIFLILATGIAIGLLFTSVGMNLYLKWIILLLTIVIFVALTNSVLEFAKIESLDIASSTSLSHRASELSKASSGIDIQKYGVLMKLFTFCFRPLFFDGNGALGLLVSIENSIYIYMFFIILRSIFLFWKRWNGFFKISVFVFLSGAFVLGQVTGNLGIAMRQKAQIMPFFFIVFCSSLSYLKNNKKRIIGSPRKIQQQPA